MPDGAVGAGQRLRRIAGDRAFLDKQFSHRHHFPLDLLTFGAAIVELAGFRIRIDFGDLERAAIPPAIAQIARVALPIIFKAAMTRDDRPVETSGDVLLSVGDEVRLGILRIDGDDERRDPGRVVSDTFSMSSICAPS